MEAALKRQPLWRPRRCQGSPPCLTHRRHRHRNPRPWTGQRTYRYERAPVMPRPQMTEAEVVGNMLALSGQDPGLNTNEGKIVSHPMLLKRISVPFYDMKNEEYAENVSLVLVQAPQRDAKPFGNIRSLRARPLRNRSPWPRHPACPWSAFRPQRTPPSPPSTR